MIFLATIWRSNQSLPFLSFLFAWQFCNEDVWGETLNGNDIVMTWLRKINSPKLKLKKMEMKMQLRTFMENARNTNLLKKTSKSCWVFQINYFYWSIYPNFLLKGLARSYLSCLITETLTSYYWMVGCVAIDIFALQICKLDWIIYYKHNSKYYEGWLYKFWGTFFENDH